MRGSHFASERRAPQHNFPSSQAYAIRQIRVAAGKLFDRNRPAVSKVVAQKFVQPRKIEFFARPYRTSLIANCIRSCSVPVTNRSS